MTWDDVTISQYYQIEDARKMYSSDIEKGNAELAVLSGIDFDELMDMDVRKLLPIQAKYKFCKEPVKGKVLKKWEGRNVKVHVKEISSGNYIDIDEAAKVERNYHLIMAILWQGEGDFEERSKKVLNEMPITVAYGCTGFFLRHYERLLIITQVFLRLKMMIARNRMKTTLSKITDGGTG